MIELRSVWWALVGECLLVIVTVLIYMSQLLLVWLGYNWGQASM